MNYPIYAGDLNNYDDLWQAADTHGGIPNPDELVFAWYESGSYEGSGYAIYERDGKVYEVETSHCSCYGPWSEGWRADETNWPSIIARVFGNVGEDRWRGPLGYGEHPEAYGKLEAVCLDKAKRRGIKTVVLP